MPAASGFDWMRQFHRALRGRYQFTFIIAFFIAVIGFSTGWQWAGLLYRSDGMVRIASALPPVLKQTDQNQPIPMFDSFIQAQQELVTSRAVLEEAAKDPLWTTSPLAHQRLSVEDLAAGLKVEARAKSENLRISYTSLQPEVAVAAVRSTITAYQAAYMRDHADREQRRLKLLEEYRASLTAQLDGATADPTIALPRSQPTTASAQHAPTARHDPQPPRRPTETAVAMVDPEFRRLIEIRARMTDELEKERVDFGEFHPAIRRLEKERQLAARRVERYVDDVYAIQLARFEDSQRAHSDPVSKLVEDAVSPVVVATVPPAILQLRREIDDVSQRIEILKTEAAMPKRFEVVTNGDFPVAVPDRRIKTAAVGGVGGAAVAVLVMVIAGLLRREYNYCADVVDDLANYSPYVAAIPELGQRSLRHTADAVQCVHQLRQTLETKSSVYMVCSATWGSGQSSVLMSLAMSLAAAGSRTLVIDADFFSRGLTTSLRLDKEVGFADVLSGCELEFCIKSNRHGLSILPAGLQIDETGLGFTPAQIAQLIERARTQFDVILIDSAPVLTSAEPGILARHVDGVLFTISRGQTKKLVMRAIQELQQSRAVILGAVFNRVSRKDFDMSIPQRARPVTTSPIYRLPDVFAEMGPLVSAMAMTVRTSSELTRYIDLKALTMPRLDVAQQNAESIAA